MPHCYYIELVISLQWCRIMVWVCCYLIYWPTSHAISCHYPFSVYCVVITFTWIVDIVLWNRLSSLLSWTCLGRITVPQFIRFERFSTVFLFVTHQWVTISFIFLHVECLPGQGMVLWSDVLPFDDLPLVRCSRLLPYPCLLSDQCPYGWPWQYASISGFAKFYFVTSVSLHMYSVMRVCWFVCSSLLLRIFGMMS